MAELESAKLPLFGEVRSDEEMLLDMHRAARRSTYVLSSGGTSREYVDIDGYYLGADGDYEFDRKLGLVRLTELVTRIIPPIIDVSRKHATTRIAFVEKPDNGPVGMLALMSLILLHSGLEGCIVRPGKRLLAASIKGRPIIRGERILIISDVATRGSTISYPARRLRDLGAVVPAAFVLLDRSHDAEQQLGREGIKLEAYWTLGKRDKVVSDLNS
jgi:orotate phosphoribosyltransferase